MQSRSQLNNNDIFRNINLGVFSFLVTVSDNKLRIPVMLNVISKTELNIYVMYHMTHWLIPYSQVDGSGIVQEHDTHKVNATLITFQQIACQAPTLYRPYKVKVSLDGVSTSQGSYFIPRDPLCHTCGYNDDLLPSCTLNVSKPGI